ncbi:MAG: Rid family detoxifying hydrolase [Candidatus Cloacimonas sp.]|jgi:2-iminobutanoate/2-iminopropanoate deaminase|nr:Rid family detoxifying hydrolase [Candidatus Cloacimonadota bacterium]
MKVINSKAAPAAVGPYSQAVLKNGLLFISGQLGIDPKTGKLCEGFEAQSRQVFSHLKSILAEANMDFGNVLKATIYVTDMANFKLLNEIYAEQFSEPFPARETVQVSCLPVNGLVEISLIAAE